MKDQVFAWLKLIRWKNLLIIIMLAMFYRYLILEPVYRNAGITQALSGLTFVTLLISLVLLSAGGYIINAVMDVRIDTFNKPDEVIIGRAINPRLALKVYYGLTFIGILLGFLTGWMTGAFKLSAMHLIAAGLFWSYSYRYKKNLLTGNLIVSLLSAMLIPTLWIFEFFALKNHAVSFATMTPQLGYIYQLILYVFGFAFLLTLAREIVKDVEDMEGDKRYGCNSLPLYIGLPRTVIVISFLLYLISISAWFWLPRSAERHQLFNNLYIIIFLILPLISVSIYLFLRQDKKSFMICSRVLKFCMISGIISLVFPLIH